MMMARARRRTSSICAMSEDGKVACVYNILDALPIRRLVVEHLLHVFAGQLGEGFRLQPKVLHHLVDSLNLVCYFMLDGYR
jgi:hypothetical protein